MNVVWGNSLWQLVKQSDVVSCLVLLILLVASIVCWAVLVYKFILCTIKKRQIKSMVAVIKNVNTFEDMLNVSRQFSKTLPGDVLAQILVYLKSLLNSEEDKKRTLSESEWNLLQDYTHQVISDVLYNEESYLPILSTTAAVAPLLGLFGTVWGLVHSFIRISEQQAADISVVAPGIAEALITTLAGLVVAIPALVMFNYLNSKVKLVEQQLVSIADKVMLLVRRLFVK